MLGELVEGILRRPGQTLAVVAVATAICVILALGTASHLPVSGSVENASERSAGAVGAVLVLQGEDKAHSQSYEISLDVLVAGAKSDPGVAGVKRGSVSDDRRTTTLGLVLAGEHERAREQTVERLRTSLDPGSLRLLVGGTTAAAVDARASIEDELTGRWWIAALAILALLFVAVGWRYTLAATIAALAGAAGAVVVLRVLGGVIELAAVGMAAAVVVGTAVGVETTIALRRRITRRTEELELSSALREATSGAGSRLLAAAGVGALGALAVLAVPVPAARAAVVGSAAAALLAGAAAVAVTPALLLASGGEQPALPRRLPMLGRVGPRATILLARALDGLERIRHALTRSRVLALGLALLATAVLVGLAAQAPGSEPVATTSLELPAGSEARQAQELASAELGGAPGSGLGPAFVAEPASNLPRDLELAAVLSALAIALCCWRLCRQVSSALVLGVSAVLAAAAAVGTLTLVFGAGRLTDLLGYADRGQPHAAAVIVAFAILVAISGARAAAAAPLLRTRGEGSGGAAGTRARRRIVHSTLPAAFISTLSAAAVSIALAASSLLAAEELGFALLAGLLLDVVAVRSLIVPALAALRPR